MPPQSDKTDTGYGPGDNVMLLIQAAPLFVVITPFWLTEWGLRSARQMVETPVYVPAGKTKQEVERELASIPARRSPRYVEYRDGDEFWKVEKENQLFLAHFHDGITVEYAK